MTKDEVRYLPLGIYVLAWKSGGHSLAAVGQYYSGAKWYVPINWTSRDEIPEGVVSTVWGRVESMRLVVGTDDLARLVGSPICAACSRIAEYNCENAPPTCALHKSSCCAKILEDA